MALHNNPVLAGLDEVFSKQDTLDCMHQLTPAVREDFVDSSFALMRVDKVFDVVG